MEQKHRWIKEEKGLTKERVRELKKTTIEEDYKEACDMNQRILEDMKRWGVRGEEGVDGEIKQLTIEECQERQEEIVKTWS